MDIAAFHKAARIQVSPYVAALHGGIRLDRAADIATAKIQAAGHIFYGSGEIDGAALGHGMVNAKINGRKIAGTP